MLASVPEMTRSAGRVALKTAHAGSSASTPRASRRSVKTSSVASGM
jgi:hypothetical protein